MARLTRDQKARLESALADLGRAIAYLEDPALIVAKPCRLAMLPEATFTRKSDGLAFGSLTKDHGSNLAGAWMARATLQRWLEYDQGTLA